MNDISICQYEHGQDRLWCLMGPFFASARVRREIGVPLASDNDTTWWVATDGDEVVGFSAARVHKKGVCEFRYGYVVPDKRRRGIYTRLLCSQIEVCSKWPIKVLRATTNDRSRGAFLKVGFQPVGMRGKCVVVERPVS